MMLVMLMLILMFFLTLMLLFHFSMLFDMRIVRVFIEVVNLLQQVTTQHKGTFYSNYLGVCIREDSFAFMGVFIVMLFIMIFACMLLTFVIVMVFMTSVALMTFAMVGDAKYRFVISI